MENQRNQLDVNYVVKNFQQKVNELTYDNIMLKAYIEQLEAELASLKESKSESK